MNLPNKLTIFRICLIPVIMIVYGLPGLDKPMFEQFEALTVCNFIILLLVFIGTMTDMLDGKIARKYNLVTNFGKFLDPIADKLLVVTGFVIIMDQSQEVGNNLFTWWMLAIILAREFIVSGVRLIAVENRRVIAASMWGKAKTTIQFITLLYLFVGIQYGPKDKGYWVYAIIAEILVYATLVSTVLSGLDYVTKNKDIFLDVNQKKNKKVKSVKK